MEDNSAPHISLVIPAWNEEAFLPRLLDTVKEARARYRRGAEAVEVIVADNSSTDRTAEIARERGCRVAPVTKRCIASSRNGGAAIARGEIVAFVDADFRIHPETFNYIDDVMRSGVCVGGGTGLVMERWSLGIAATWWAIMPPLLLLGMDGGVWFCRRADFEQVDGYNEAVRAGEDVRFLTALKRLGCSRRPKQKLANRFTARRLGLDRAFAIASCRKFDIHGDWHMFSETLRGLYLLLFGRGKIDDLIQRNWYDEVNRQ